MVNGPDEYAIRLDEPADFGDQYLSKASPFGVDTSGKIICRYPIEGYAPYCLTTWLCPADYRGPIWITETASGTRQLLEITAEIIVRTEPATQ